MTNEVYTESQCGYGWGIPCRLFRWQALLTSLNDLISLSPASHFVPPPPGAFYYTLETQLTQRLVICLWWTLTLLNISSLNREQPSLSHLNQNCIPCMWTPLFNDSYPHSVCKWTDICEFPLLLQCRSRRQFQTHKVEKKLWSSTTLTVIILLLGKSEFIIMFHATPQALKLWKQSRQRTTQCSKYSWMLTTEWRSLLRWGRERLWIPDKRKAYLCVAERGWWCYHVFHPLILDRRYQRVGCSVTHCCSTTLKR